MQSVENGVLWNVYGSAGSMCRCVLVTENTQCSLAYAYRVLLYLFGTYA